MRQLDRRIAGMSWDEIHAQAAALSADMPSMQAGLPQVSALAVSDAEGRLWAASVPLGASHASVVHREFWLAQREADRDTFISRAYVGRQTGVLNFGIS